MNSVVYLKIDFANRFIGGGVMNKGMVQEEILFMIFPELMMAKLMCSKMEKSEAIVIKGVKRFSNYTGYSNKTKYTGEFEECQKLDSFGRIGKFNFNSLFR
jgi:poly(ADP-ribose) glycohydrolase